MKNGGCIYPRGRARKPEGDSKEKRGETIVASLTDKRKGEDKEEDEKEEKRRRRKKEKKTQRSLSDFDKPQISRGVTRAA